ncbi:MAG: IS6 family transposase [Nitrososphaera sp.]
MVSQSIYNYDTIPITVGKQMIPQSQTPENSRERKAMKIAVANGVEELSKNMFLVRSQADPNVYYEVERLENNRSVFSCGCKDFLYRISKGVASGSSSERACKHIKSVIMHLQQKEIIQNIEQNTKQLPKICSRCQSTKFVRNGFRIVKGDVKRQRYKCLQCRKRFIVGENGFCKTADPNIVTEALNLIFSGLSYRACSRHLYLAHGKVWHHTSILTWVRKYTQIMKEFVDSLKPELGDVWCIDEMMLNVKDTQKTGVGFYDWAWSIISPQTRFVLAVEISKRRETEDARSVLAKGKESAKGDDPSYLISDSLMSYREAFMKELDARKTMHIKTNSLRDGFQNRPIERYHNEVRQTTKARRGLGNDDSAQEFLEFHRIVHNFVRPHTGLPDEQTPAEAANLNLKLNPQNKLKDLISKSVEHKAISSGKFAVHLGKRIQLVDIANEKDCVKVKPKGWMDKQVWKEINDILRLHEFAWLSNGRDSCWIKMS